MNKKEKTRSRSFEAWARHNEKRNAWANREKEFAKYIEEQKSWVKRNGIVFGAKVIVTRKSGYGERGSTNEWLEGMDEFVGKEATVFMVTYHSVVLYSDSYNGIFSFPYFCLKTIKNNEYVNNPPLKSRGL